MAGTKHLAIALAVLVLFTYAAAETTDATTEAPDFEIAIAVPQIVEDAEGVIEPTVTATTARRACIPVCDATGTRSEGWYDSCTGGLIMWSNCARSKAVCRGEGTRSEGWYDALTGELIKYGNCYDPDTTTIVDPDVPNCVCPALYAPVCAVSGVTYSNSCVAKCAGVGIEHDGKCRGYTTCEYYEDDRGCKITKCTDGSSKIECPGAYEPECKRYFVGDQGCTVKECTDGTKITECPEVAVVNECKRYEDEDGCIVVKCDDGTAKMECPVTPAPTPVVTPVVDDGQFECKYYFDEDGCKVRSCRDGTTEVMCPTPALPCAPTPALPCAVPEPVPECKKVETEDGCVKKVCDNGYEAVYCPEVAEEVLEVECKVYIDDEGCRVQSCANGAEHRSCPSTDADNCKAYEEANGCITVVCENGKKYEKCPAMDVVVRPEKAIARVKATKLSWSKVAAQHAVDLDNVAIRVPVESARGISGGEEVEISKEGERVWIRTKDVAATASHEVRVEQNRLKVGEKLVNILPDQALENVMAVAKKMEVRAAEIMAEGERARYDVKGVEKGNLLFVIPVEMEVTASVDAESGEVSNFARPWWSFLVWG